MCSSAVSNSSSRSIPHHSPGWALYSSTGHRSLVSTVYSSRLSALGSRLSARQLSVILLADAGQMNHVEPRYIVHCHSSLLSLPLSFTLQSIRPMTKGSTRRRRKTTTTTNYKSAATGCVYGYKKERKTKQTNDDVVVVDALAAQLHPATLLIIILKVMYDVVHATQQ